VILLIEPKIAANEGNMKELYQVTRILSKKKVLCNRPVKIKQRVLLMNEKEQMELWREYFDEGLNRGGVEEIEVEDEAMVEYSDNEFDSEIPTKEEIRKSLKQIKFSKALGADNIVPELIIVDPGSTVELLHPLFKKIWETESMPLDWRKGLLVKLPKKWEITNRSNWRGITLLSIPSKVFTLVILNRIRYHIDIRLRREQASFRSNRSCTDQINTLRIIIGQSNEFIAYLYLVFEDFEKAFDLIKRKSLWKTMRTYGLPEKIVSVIEETRNYACQVIHYGKATDPIALKSGVRQGCILSPTLFLLVMDEVMRRVTEGKRRGIQWGLTERLEDLDFADGICLLSQKCRDIAEKLRDLEDEAKVVGLKVNSGETKLTKINTNVQNQLQVNGENKSKTIFQFLAPKLPDQFRSNSVR
jgi:hypothetical protein